MSTRHPDHNLISTTSVEGTSIYDRNSKSIGTIDHLMIEKSTGMVRYGVISFGGFLGMGKSHYPIPWSAFQYAPQLSGFVTDITADKLRDAPEFSDDSWSSREWENDVHSHYGVQPYWDESGTLGTYGSGGSLGRTGTAPAVDPSVRNASALNQGASDPTFGARTMHQMPSGTGVSGMSDATWQRIRGDWNMFKGKLRQRWGQLTDDDLQQAQGSSDQLIGVIQARTGQTREEIERQINSLGPTA